jgi:hypothetical protein
MKVYISGPMTGLPGNNFPAFMAAEYDLTTRGFEVLNPARNQLPPDSTWADYMRKDIAMLLQADSVCLLPGWIKSRGARLEAQIAQALGMPISEYALMGEERA